MKNSFLKNPVKISRISTIIILLALVRTLAEPFRLQAYSSSSLTFHEIMPFLLAALLCSAGLFAMILFSFYKKYLSTIISAVMVIFGMLIIKALYL